MPSTLPNLQLMRATIEYLLQASNRKDGLRCCSLCILRENKMSNNMIPAKRVQLGLLPMNPTTIYVDSQ